MAKIVSIPQIQARWHSGHKDAVMRLARGEPIVPPTARMSEVRGAMTIMATLRRWNAVGTDNALTDLGQELAAMAQQEEDRRLAAHRDRLAQDDGPASPEPLSPFRR